MVWSTKMSSRMDDHLERLEKNKKLIERVEHCQENGAECNDWEDTFLESIHDQLMNGRVLTDVQIGKIEQIEFLVEFGREAYWEEFKDV
jgi:hypothetical protein